MLFSLDPKCSFRGTKEWDSQGDRGKTTSTLNCSFSAQMLLKICYRPNMISAKQVKAIWPFRDLEENWRAFGFRLMVARVDFSHF